MTPTLWPGFSPSWLQPDNFLASKAIWYPAARQRCGSNREARALGNRKDILCPLLAHGIPLHQLGEAAKPSPQVLQCWAKPSACLLDKTQGASFAACRPGQLQNGQQARKCHMHRAQEPALTIVPRPQVLPSLITQDTGLGSEESPRAQAPP